MNERHEEPVTVYNLAVKYWVSYFVWKVRVYVHNGAYRSNRTNNIIVTEGIVMNAMKDVQLKTQQKSVNIPVIQKYVNRVLDVEINIPHIKVDGNHRCITSRITGINVDIQMWSGGRQDNLIDWADVILDT